jgi:hypothetical protein
VGEVERYAARCGIDRPETDWHAIFADFPVTVIL